MKISKTIIRPTDWPWYLAVWFAVGEYRYESVENRPGEYVGTGPVAIQR